MKINDISNSLGQLGNLDSNVVKNKEDQNSAENVDQKNSQSGTRVEISNTSVEVNKAVEKMDVVPEERVKKIEDLKMMVSNDTYNVDSKKIAEKIMNDSLFKLVEP
jgi:flagellar biosynthesis anti-sigma factor FlgM